MIPLTELVVGNASGRADLAQGNQIKRIAQIKLIRQLMFLLLYFLAQKLEGGEFTC